MPATPSPTARSFRTSLDAFIAALPPNNRPGASVPRQTVLFSATVPRAVLDVAHVALRPGYKLVDCVDADEPETNVQVCARARP